MSQEVRYNDHMRKYVDQIIAKYPEEMRREFDQGQDDFEDYRRDETDSTSMSSLQSLLGKTIKALRLTHRKQLYVYDVCMCNICLCLLCHCVYVCVFMCLSVCLYTQISWSTTMYVFLCVCLIYFISKPCDIIDDTTSGHAIL